MFVVLGFLLSGNAYAEIRTMEKTTMFFKGSARGIESGINTVCVDGYKFIIARAPDAISVTQIFEEKNDKSLPAKC